MTHLSIDEYKNFLGVGPTKTTTLSVWYHGHCDQIVKIKMCKGAFINVGLQGYPTQSGLFENAIKQRQIDTPYRIKLHL